MLAAERDSTPWYHQPWPWILMALPLAAVVGGFVTLALALHTEDGLVANDYYREGLAINRQLQREEEASKLGLRVQAVADAEHGLVRVHLDARAPLPRGLGLRLVHPTRAGMDQAITLKAQPGGWYEGRLANSQAAHWQVILEDAGHSWRLDGTWDTAHHAAMRFPAP